MCLLMPGLGMVQPVVNGILLLTLTQQVRTYQFLPPATYQRRLLHPKHYTEQNANSIHQVAPQRNGPVYHLLNAEKWRHGPSNNVD